MLIHVSRFIIWQDCIATLVDAELKFYQRQIEMKSGNLLAELKIIWEKDFVPTTTMIMENQTTHVDSELS